MSFDISSDCARHHQAAVLNDVTAPLRPYLDQDDVTELCINQPGGLFLETFTGWERITDSTITEPWLDGFAKASATYADQTIGETSPILSAHMPSGERLQIIVPPAAGAISVTIRKPSDQLLTLSQLAETGTFDPLAEIQRTVDPTLAARDVFALDGPISLIQHAIQNRLNIIIAGATGSGKTTLSKAMIQAIPLDERLITIEDARELEFAHQNAVRLYYSRDGSGVSAVTAHELLVACLRMKPDRILLAELRDDEAYTYLRNVNSGHPGSITTVHANTPPMALEQIMLMIKQSPAGSGLSREDIKALVISLVDVIIQMHRRQVTDIHFPRLEHAA